MAAAGHADPPAAPRVRAGAPFRLACHPAGDAGPLRSLTATVARLPGGSLQLEFVLGGDLDAVRIPAPAAPGRADRLWEHTCVEAFVPMPAVAPGYHEFNLSPAGAWAAYGFRDYRAGMTALAVAEPPRVTQRREADRLMIGVTIPAALLPAPAEPLRLALAAVVEDQRGAFRYWALHHPAAGPDFHAPASVVALLAPVPAA